MNIKKFVKERNEAMFSLEKEKIVAYCENMMFPFPKTSKSFGQEFTSLFWLSKIVPTI